MSEGRVLGGWIMVESKQIGGRCSFMILRGGEGELACMQTAPLSITQASGLVAK